MVMSSPEGSSRDAALFQPNKALTKDLQGFTQTTCEQARLVLTKRMPEKILYITELIKEKDEYREFFVAQEQVQKAKKTKTMARAETESAAYLLSEREFEQLKLEVLELVDMTAVVKLWLQLNVPRIEDGNNFGVSIQSDTVGELARIEDSALMTVENWSKFLMLRAKVVGKIQKHTGVGHAAPCQAYRSTLEALDEKQLRSVWIGWLDLRNNFAVIYDLLMKNIEKLVNPRSANTSNMY